MKLPPAAAYASSTSRDSASSAVQPNTLPPRQIAKTSRSVRPSGAMAAAVWQASPSAALRLARPRRQAENLALGDVAATNGVAHDLADQAGRGDADLEHGAPPQRATPEEAREAREPAGVGRRGRAAQSAAVHEAADLGARTGRCAAD